MMNVITTQFGTRLGKLSLGLSIITIVVSLTACQAIQPFDGQTGYQRESNNNNQLLLSYVMDAKSNEQITQQKLQKACARELGLGVGKTVSYKVIDQQEFVNINRNTSGDNQQTIALGQTKASFGLSSTPKLSNTDNNAKMDMLDSKPAMLKRITFQCAQ